MAKELEKIMRHFLWNGTDTKRGQNLVRWEKIIRPIEEGGLGITNIKDKNKALLAKWIWRYLLEESALWRRVIDAKYGPFNYHQTALHHSLSSAHGPWKYILRHKSLIMDRSTKKIGDGSSTCFWNDIWLENDPLATTYPLLFTLHTKKDASVKDMWSAATSLGTLAFEEI